MACNCGKRRKKATREIATSATALSDPLGDVALLKYTGSEKDVFYGVVSGNRYSVSPGDVIEADKADCETGIPTMPGLLENGLFTVLD